MAAIKRTREETAREREYWAQWREAQRQKRNAQSREGGRRWRAKNPEAVAAARRIRDDKWRAAHPEKRASSNKKWYRNNKKQAVAASIAWHKKNPEKKAASFKTWRLTHREQFDAITRNRQARVRNAPGSHTHVDILNLYEAQQGMCAGCGVAMSTSGAGKYTVDHIKPLKPKGRGKPGSNSPKNLQLLCKPCNSRKRNKSPREWAAELSHRRMVL